MTMGTASTMTAIAEIDGMTLRVPSSTPRCCPSIRGWPIATVAGLSRGLGESASLGTFFTAASFDNRVITDIGDRWLDQRDPFTSRDGPPRRRAADA